MDARDALPLGLRGGRCRGGAGCREAQGGRAADEGARAEGRGHPAEACAQAEASPEEARKACTGPEEADEEAGEDGYEEASKARGREEEIKRRQEAFRQETSRREESPC